jgi:acetyltransferase-like isoleucine patch superfamily enzyme
MDEKIYIVGSGGHAKALAARLGITKTVVFITEQDLDIKPKNIDQRFVSEQVFLETINDKGKIFNGIGITQNSLHARERVRQKFQNSGVDFDSYLSNSAIVDESAQISNGVQIFEHSYLGADVAVGLDSIVSVGAIVEHDCEIGSQVFVGPGAIICGGVSIQSMAIIGAGAIVLPGARVLAGQLVPSGTRVG